jgi:hypothetical protein
MIIFGYTFHAGIDNVRKDVPFFDCVRDTPSDTLVWIGRFHLVISDERGYRF